MDAFAGFSALKPSSGSSELLFPMLFVTVACGACSGFHALVSSGTTSKQVASEKHFRPIAYGSMLVEGVLALIALIAVAWMSSADYAEAITKEKHVILFAKGVAGFTKTIGIPVDLGITLCFPGPGGIPDDNIGYCHPFGPVHLAGTVSAAFNVRGC